MGLHSNGRLLTLPTNICLEVNGSGKHSSFAMITPIKFFSTGPRWQQGSRFVLHLLFDEKIIKLTTPKTRG